MTRDCSGLFYFPKRKEDSINVRIENYDKCFAM